MRHVAEKYSKKGPDLLGQTSKVRGLGFGDLFLPVCMHTHFATVLRHEWEHVKSDVLRMSIKMHNNMRIHMYTCATNVYVNVYIRYMCMRMYICTCNVCMACITYVYVYICMNTYVYVCPCMCVCLYICMCNESPHVCSLLPCLGACGSQPVGGSRESRTHSSPYE